MVDDDRVIGVGVVESSVRALIFCQGDAKTRPPTITKPLSLTVRTV